MSAPAFLTDGRFASGLSYARYEDLLRSYAAKNPAEAPTDQERRRLGLAALNLQRASRLWRTCSLSPALCEAVKAISAPQRWMVLSEPWCGDSAQCIPVIARVAEQSPLITLRMLLRDMHPGVMDLYLTEGKRSIPKLVVFREDGEELFRWGPRPAPAQHIVDAAINEGVAKETREERLHRWYGSDRGKTVEEELRNLLIAKRAMHST